MMKSLVDIPHKQTYTVVKNKVYFVLSMRQQKLLLVRQFFVIITVIFKFGSDETFYLMSYPNRTVISNANFIGNQLSLNNGYNTLSLSYTRSTLVMQGCPEWRTSYFIYYSTASDVTQIRVCS